MLRQAAVSVALALTAVACGGSSAGPSQTPTFHGEIVDPAGDAPADPRVAIPPDLIRVTGDVAGGTLTLVIQFAPATLNPQTTRAAVLLDTDQVASTGIAQGNGLGADYGLDLSAATSQATVTKANPAACAASQSCFDAIGSATMTLGPDRMQVTVPLSMLGGDDGRMSFRASTYVLVAPLTPIVFDVAPDNNLPPGRIQ